MQAACSCVLTHPTIWEGGNNPAGQLLSPVLSIYHLILLKYARLLHDIRVNNPPHYIYMNVKAGPPPRVLACSYGFPQMAETGWFIGPGRKWKSGRRGDGAVTDDVVVFASSAKAPVPLEQV